METSIYCPLPFFSRANNAEVRAMTAWVTPPRRSAIDGDWRYTGGTILAAGETHDARYGGEVDLVSGPLGIGPILTVACDGAINKPGVELLHCCIIHAAALEDTRTVGLYNYIHLLRQTVEDSLAFLLL